MVDSHKRKSSADHQQISRSRSGTIPMHACKSLGPRSISMALHCKKKHKWWVRFAEFLVAKNVFFFAKLVLFAQNLVKSPHGDFLLKAS